MPKRLLILTQLFDPEPTFKGLSFAKELIKRGYSVEVVTGFPNYPGGKLYPGYRMRWLHRETIDGVPVTRLPLYPSHDSSAVKRIATYASFAAAAFLYCLFGVKKVDVVYAYHPPLTIGVVASLIKLFFRIPVVYDIHDLWPDTLHATGMISSKKILNVVGHVANWIYRHMDSIVVNTPGFYRLLVERGVPEEKITVIYSWCDETALKSPDSPASDGFPKNGKFRILFAGTMGKAQALDSVLDAASRLKTDAPHIQFVFVGGGIKVEELKQTAQTQSLSNVTFLPKLPMNRIGSLLKTADVLLVHLKEDPLFKITIPSKTQAYMAIGKPILMAVQGDAAELVGLSRCAVEATSEDAASIAQAASQLASLSNKELEEMGRRGKNYYDDHLAVRIGVDRFAKIFNDLTSQGGRASE